jgi:mannose/fructose/N-acetylgalactosamine-specific phosphotransferase system component IIC
MMQNSGFFQSFYLRITVISLLCAGISGKAAVEGLLPLSPLMRYLPILLFWAISMVTHRMILNAQKGRPAQFINTFIGTQALKMFVHMIVMVTVAMLNESDAVPFIASYAILYLIFTVTEVISLMPLVRKKD